MTETARLQELEDREAIRQLFVDYARFLDAGDYAGYTALFAQDGVFGDATGPAAIGAAMAVYGERVEAARSAGQFTTAIHLLGNHDIRISGDTATANLLWSYVAIGADELPVLLQMGTYRDDLVRENGGWKIARHRIDRIMGRGQLDARAPAPIDGLEKRLREIEDREAIQRVFLAAQDALDGRDLAGYGALFTEDGEWAGVVGRAVGPEAIAEILGRYCKPWESEGHRTYHTTADIAIDLDGDTAKASSKWQHIVRGERDEPVTWHLGHYDDRLRRTPDGWRFTRRAAYGDIPYIAPKFQLIGLAQADGVD
jgi:ketosteroid isomerase-like protein